MDVYPLEKVDLPDIKQLIDRTVGVDYLTLPDLLRMYDRSYCKGKMCSFVLKDDTGTVSGLRLTHPPKSWNENDIDKISVKKWPHKFDETAYFKTIVVDENVSGQGFGKKLSLKSIQILKECGAKGIVCHSWKQSPHNSSMRYLTALGFVPIAEHPQFWSGHACTICGDSCYCTAIEMYLDLEK